MEPAKRVAWKFRLHDSASVRKQRAALNASSRLKRSEVFHHQVFEPLVGVEVLVLALSTPM